MKINRYWVQKGDNYELCFEYNYEIETILKFTPDKDDSNCYQYTTEYSGSKEVFWEFFDSVDEAKEYFESIYEDYLSDQAQYYKELLEKWNEEN